MGTPTITSVTPNTYELGSGADSTATITGTNLASTYRVYLESATDSNKQYDITNTITNLTNTGLTVTIPTDQTNPELETGEYTIHVVTQGTDESGVTVGFSYTKKTLPDGVLESTDDYGNDGHVAVDYDENLIPIKITSSRYGSPTITALPKSEIDSDPSVWYDYSADVKQWANAVTVTNPENYKNITSETTINDSDILGYWVYIPRYAYKVMRRDASDRAVSDTTASRNGGFEIKFETASDPKKTPVKCSQTGQDYQTCVGASALEYPTDPADKDKTAWATHPAFSWGTDADGYEEMNGFWIGKFETTQPRDGQSGGYPGSSTPTVLPDAIPLGVAGYSYNNSPWAGIGDIYDTAKKFGIEDVNNTYGGSGYDSNSTISSGFRQNNHNLLASTSHVIKNNEWGAVIYLASSKFGVGMDSSIQPNLHVDYSDYTTRTGCGTTSGNWYDCIFTNSNVVGSSTTGTEYGVYDMVGGAWDLAMGSYGNNGTPAASDGFTRTPRPPYLQVYSMTNSAGCTWETCGGDATYEVSNSTIYPSGSGGSVVNDRSYSMWGSAYGSFVSAGSYDSGPWFARSLGADIIISGMGVSSQSGSNVYMYGIWAIPNEAVTESEGSVALRVVLRSSMNNTPSGGDGGGDDNESEGTEKPAITSVGPNSIAINSLTSNTERIWYFQIEGQNLTSVSEIWLDTGNSYTNCNFKAASDTQGTCQIKADYLINYDPPVTYKADLIDRYGNNVGTYDSFVTITW